MDRDRANAAFQAFLECTGHVFVSTAWLDVPSYHNTAPYFAPKVHGPYPKGFVIKRILTAGRYLIEIPNGGKVATDPLYRELGASGMYPLAVIARHEARRQCMYVIQYRVYVIENAWQGMRIGQ